MRRGELVGLDAGYPVVDCRVDEDVDLPPEQRGRRDAGVGGDLDALTTALAAGGVTLGFFPSSGEPADGGIDFHALGAFAAFFSGNVLSILLGGAHWILGFSPQLGIGLKIVGVYGLLSIPVYLAVASSEAGTLIGLAERGIVDPFLIGLPVVGERTAQDLSGTWPCSASPSA